MRSRTTKESGALPTLFMSHLACTMDKQAARATRIVVRNPGRMALDVAIIPYSRSPSRASTTRRPTSAQVKVKAMR